MQLARLSCEMLESGPAVVDSVEAGALPRKGRSDEVLSSGIPDAPTNGIKNANCNSWRRVT